MSTTPIRSTEQAMCQLGDASWAAKHQGSGYEPSNPLGRSFLETLQAGL